MTFISPSFRRRRYPGVAGSSPVGAIYIKMVRIDCVARDVPLPTLNGEIRNILYRGMEPKKQSNVRGLDNEDYINSFLSYRQALGSIPVRPDGRRKDTTPAC